jgi:hypothetical protein
MIQRVDWAPSAEKLRIFGATAVVVVGVLWMEVRSKHVLVGIPLSSETAHNIEQQLLLGAASIGALAVLLPTLLKPLYLGLMVVTWPIGLALSECIMLALYIGVITPMGVAARIIGRDPLGRGFKPSAKSYWKPRSKHRIERYMRQY